MAECLDPAWLCWVEHHPGLAGWFQAVFSVLGILAAGLAPYLLWRLDLRRREQVRAKYAVHAAAVVTGAIESFALSAQNTEQRRFFAQSGFPTHILGSAVEALQSVSIADFEDAELAILLRQFAVQLAGAQADAKALEQFVGDYGGPEWASEVEQRAATVRELYTQLVEHVESRHSSKLLKTVRFLKKTLKTAHS